MHSGFSLSTAEVEAWELKKQQLQAEKKKMLALSFPLPLSNEFHLFSSDPNEAVRAKVPFAACLADFASPANINDFYSSALQTKSPATR